MERGYRCVATSVEGFVAQVVQYITKGYRYYVTGQVPERIEDPGRLDRKLIEKYGIDLPKWTRARRRKLGYANLRYLRHGRFFVIFSTPGRHEFFEAERNNVRDIWKVPLRFRGYSISYRQGGYQRKKDKSYVVVPGTKRRVPKEPLRVDRKRRGHVRLDEETYKRLRDYLLEQATHRSAEALCRMFYGVPFEPYAPVREQVKRILIRVNKARRRAGFERVPYTAIRYRRRIVEVFGPGNRKAENGVSVAARNGPISGSCGAESGCLAR